MLARSGGLRWRRRGLIQTFKVINRDGRQVCDVFCQSAGVHSADGRRCASDYTGRSKSSNPTDVAYRLRSKGVFNGSNRSEELNKEKTAERAYNPNKATKRKGPRTLQERAYVELVSTAGSMRRAPRDQQKKALDHAEAIFASLDESAKIDEPDFYRLLIRIAISAGQLSRAFEIFEEMRAQGIAPQPAMYRAMFEGMSKPGIVRPQDEITISKLRNVFRLMVDDCKVALSKLQEGKGTESDLGPVSNYEEGDDTNQSLALSREENQIKLILDPTTFINNYCQFLHFLIDKKRIMEANKIFLGSKELMATDIAQSLFPHLPCIVATRYTKSIVVPQLKDVGEMEDNLKFASVMIMNAVLNHKTREKLVNHLHPNANPHLYLQRHRQRDQYAIDVCLSALFNAIVKFHFRRKGIMTANLIQMIYEDQYLASLPAITDDLGLRAVTALLAKDHPQLCLDVYNRAIKYYQSSGEVEAEEKALFEEEIKGSYFRRLETVEVRHGQFVFSNALVCALKLDQLEDGLSILEQVKRFKEGNARIRSDRMPFTIVMSDFMKKFAMKDDWESALRLMEYHLDDPKEKRRGKGVIFLVKFITHFLDLALRQHTRSSLPSDSSGEEDIDITLSSSANPLEEAIKYMIEEIGLLDPLWIWCQSALEGKAEELGDPNRREEYAPIKTAVEFLSAVHRSCTLYLQQHNEEMTQSTSSTVESCKDLLKRADRHHSSHKSVR